MSSLILGAGTEGFSVFLHGWFKIAHVMSGACKGNNIREIFVVLSWLLGILAFLYF